MVFYIGALNSRLCVGCAVPWLRHDLQKQTSEFASRLLYLLGVRRRAGFTVVPQFLSCNVGMMAIPTHKIGVRMKRADLCTVFAQCLVRPQEVLLRKINFTLYRKCISLECVLMELG